MTKEEILDLVERVHERKHRRLHFVIAFLMLITAMLSLYVSFKAATTAATANEIAKQSSDAALAVEKAALTLQDTQTLIMQVQTVHMERQSRQVLEMELITHNAMLMNALSKHAFEISKLAQGTHENDKFRYQALRERISFPFQDYLTRVKIFEETFCDLGNSSSASTLSKALEHWYNELININDFGNGSGQLANVYRGKLEEMRSAYFVAYLKTSSDEDNNCQILQKPD